MRGRLLIFAALLLASCGADVRDQRAPEDNQGFSEIFRQLDPDEKLAFSTWWNLRAEKVRNGAATDSDFNLTVRQAIDQTIASRPQRQAEAAAREDCFNQGIDEARNSTELEVNGWVPPKAC